MAPWVKAHDAVRPEVTPASCLGFPEITPAYEVLLLGGGDRSVSGEAGGKKNLQGRAPEMRCREKAP